MIGVVHTVAVVLGTRPEIVKLGGIIRLLGPIAWVVDTGQHFDENLNAQFFDAFGLARPQDALGVGGGARGAQIGQATERLDALFSRRRPSAVIVQGDTNSALSGALAANSQGIPLAHVEAGLRSFDRLMPEEHNRVLVDHMSDLCLAPTAVSVANLAAERIDASRIFETGNTVVEAVRSMLPEANRRRDLVATLGLERERFVVSTFHRPENVDDADALAAILDALAALPLPVVLPMHPRTRARASAFGLNRALDALRVMEPLDYTDFISLVAECALVVGDSGGLQEEVSVLKRPMIVVRRSTERPEVLGTFADLVPVGPAVALAAAEVLRDLPERLAGLAALPSPYGDGDASRRCVELILTMAPSAAPAVG